MTPEQIRGLLGGYATNTLTESERRALMQAALEDQELFNALQDDEALRDLLADPAAREQVRAALAAKEAPRAVWWWRSWAWGGALTAAAAAVLTVMVIRRMPPEPPLEPVRIASTQEAPKPVASNQAPVAAPRENNARENKEKRAFAAPAPPPVAARAPEAPAPAATQGELSSGGARQAQTLQEKAQESQVQQSQGQLSQGQQTQVQPARVQPAPVPQAQAQQVQVQQEQVQVQAQNQVAVTSAARDLAEATIPPAPAKQKATFDTAARLSKTPSLRYSVLRRNANGTFEPLPPGGKPKAGDSIRVSVTPEIAGNLTVYRVVKPAQAKRVFPPTESAIAVEANVNYVVPESDIELTADDQRLRVVLEPQATDALKKDRRVEKVAAPAPVIVEIPIGGN